MMNSQLSLAWRAWRICGKESQMLTASQEADRIERDFRDHLTDVLVERNPLELPEAMIEKQLEYMLENLQNRLQSQGMSCSNPLA
jgi:FKBP-type peptidyl-prolyl cis-trans isomerase (trigger factor)